MSEPENKPTRVILHCTATPDLSPGDPQYNYVNMSLIRKWHIERGFRYEGYHALIQRDGTIEYGLRSFDEYGAHTNGQNKNTLGFVLAGTKEFTALQVESLISLYQIIYIDYGIDFKNWFCHYNFTSKKTCPNIPLQVLRKLLYYATPIERKIENTIH